jgi:hypothetical protein
VSAPEHAPANDGAARGILARLPTWARPLAGERGGSGSLRLAENTIVIIFGLLLAVATVNDLVGQTHVNHRLAADLRAWRTATGHDYRNLDIEQDIKSYTSRDVVCGNVSPGAPGERAQICLAFTGPILAGRRSVSGGYYLPPKLTDARENRYGCFGAAASSGLCGRSSPPPGAPPAPAFKTGLP